MVECANDQSLNPFIGGRMKFREAIVILQNKGYILDRVKGSHYIYTKEGKEIIVPKHSNDLPTFIIRNVRKAK